MTDPLIEFKRELSAAAVKYYEDREEWSEYIHWVGCLVFCE